MITGLLALLAAVSISGLAGAPRQPGRQPCRRQPGRSRLVPAVNAVAFSPDGTLLAAGYGDGTVRLWVTATGRERGPALRSGSGPVTGVAFSPDGAMVAGADADGTIVLWDPATGAAIGSPLQAGSGVNGVAFSPDGSCWPAPTPTAGSPCGTARPARSPVRCCIPAPVPPAA